MGDVFKPKNGAIAVKEAFFLSIKKHILLLMLLTIDNIRARCSLFEWQRVPFFSSAFFGKLLCDILLLYF